MATGKKNFFDRAVKSFLPNETIYEIAKETGFMQRSDISGLKIDEWVKDMLLLIDRGFYGYKTFYKISKNEGYFITRFKEPNKFVIVKDNLAGERKDNEDSPVGMKVNEALFWLRRDVFDVEVELGIDMRSKCRGQIPRKRLQTQSG